MKVLLDTNVVLMAIPSKSRYRPIIDAFTTRRYSLVLTTEIFLEYEEILTQKANAFVATFASTAFLEAPNTVGATVWYRLDLIKADPDDNKFTDAYLASAADFLVTTDAHFDTVKEKAFPKINVVTPDEFLNVLKLSV